MFLFVWNIGQTRGDAAAATRTLSCSSRHAFCTFYLHECFFPLKYSNTMRGKTPTNEYVSRRIDFASHMFRMLIESDQIFFLPRARKTDGVLTLLRLKLIQPKKTRRQDGARNNFTCHYLDCDCFTQSQRASRSFPLMSCVGLFNFTRLDSFH